MANWTLPQVVSICFRHGAIVAKRCDRLTCRILATLRKGFAKCEFKPLSEVLGGKSLAIHHGGLTTAITCLLAGIPQLVLPMYLEQHLNAIALSQLGVATMLTKPTWQGLLMAQTQAYALTENAKLQAESLAHWNQNFMEVVIQTCLKFLSRPSLV